MTDKETSQNWHIELGAIAYELVIAVQSVAVGVETIKARRDVPPGMVQPLAILENLANRATEAAIVLQNAMWDTFGISGVSVTPANDPGDANGEPGDGPGES